MPRKSKTSAASIPEPPPSDGFRAGELELWDRVYKRWQELLEGQFKIAALVVSVILALVGFLGIHSIGSLVEDTVKAEVKTAVDKAKDDVNQETELLAKQLAEKQATISFKIAELTEQTQKAQKLIKEMEAIRDRITKMETELDTRIKGIENNVEARLGSANTELERLTNVLKKSDQTVQGLQQKVSRVDQIASSLATIVTPSSGERTSEPLPEDVGVLRSALNIRQVPVRLDEANTSTTRTTYLLTLSATVDPLVNRDNASKLLNSIKQVTYTLSPRWFRPNVIPRTNPNDNFQYSITVWGVTPIKAKAEFFGNAAPICWSGSINLTSETKLSRAPCES